jgi:hypothetical protein
MLNNSYLIIIRFANDYNFQNFILAIVGNNNNVFTLIAKCLFAVNKKTYFNFKILRTLSLIKGILKTENGLN